MYMGRPENDLGIYGGFYSAIAPGRLRGMRSALDMTYRSVIYLRLTAVTRLRLCLTVYYLWAVFGWPLR